MIHSVQPSAFPLHHPRHPRTGAPLLAGHRSVRRFAAARKAGIERAPGAREVEGVAALQEPQAFMPGLYNVGLRLTDEAGNVTVTGRARSATTAPAPAKVWRRVERRRPARGAHLRRRRRRAVGRACSTRCRAYHAHATFFPLGPFAAASSGPDAPHASPKVTRVGSHGWTHTVDDAPELRRRAERVDPQRGALVERRRRDPGSLLPPALRRLQQLDGRRVRLGRLHARHPVGRGSAGLERAGRRRHRPARALSRVRPGSIVVMHLRPQTAAALPAILSGLRARGYKAVSLPELFRAAGYR